MTGRWAAYVRGALIGAAGLAYYLLAYTTSASERASLPVALFGLAPLIALVLLLSRRSGQRFVLRAVSTFTLLAMGFAMVWPRLQAHPAWLYFLQHALGNLLLATIFGRSLFGGRQALVTYFASFSHRPTLSPLVARYTRHVTLAWTLFFLSMASISTLLFALAPVEFWSIFANLLSFPLVVGMFLGEYLVRRRVLPIHERTSIMGSIRAYRSSMAQAKKDAEEHP